MFFVIMDRIFIQKCFYDVILHVANINENVRISYHELDKTIKNHGTDLYTTRS